MTGDFAAIEAEVRQKPRTARSLVVTLLTLKAGRPATIDLENSLATWEFTQISPCHRAVASAL
jgi:hypothetical protein